MIVKVKILGVKSYTTKDNRKISQYVAEPIGLAEGRPVLVELSQENGPEVTPGSLIEAQVVGQGFSDRNKLSLVVRIEQPKAQASK